MATILISFLLILIVYRILRSLIKQKENGCGGACSGCHACHHGSQLYKEYKQETKPK